MAIENLLIAKIIGGVVVLGGTGTAGYVYKEKLSEWIDNLTSKNIYTYVVTSTVTEGASSTTTNDELYTPSTKENIKNKNYQCVLSNVSYECDIIEKIEKDTTNKWKKINNKLTEEASPSTDLTKSIFNTVNDLYLLKITSKTELKFEKSSIITVVTKNKGEPIIFGKLKPLIGKENKNLWKNIDLFLGKIKDFGSDATTFTISSEKTYKCGFADAKQPTPTTDSLKKCGIYKFTSSSQSNPSAEKNYDQLNFAGQEVAVTTSDTLNKNEYYIIKFTDSEITVTDYSGKDLIYLEEVTVGEVVSTKKVINFSSITPAALTLDGDNNKNLLLVT